MLSDIFPNAPRVNQEQIDGNTILVWANGEFKLGFPANIKRFLAYTRNGPWLHPFWGPQMEDGRDMSAVLMETNGGEHVIVRAEWSFNASESHIRMENDGWKIVTQTPVASFFFTLSETFLGFDTAPIVSEPWVNDFGFCTWNSLGTNVDSRNVLEGVDSLVKVGAGPRVVIIDDGWQQLDSERRLAAVTPREDKFPKGFRGVVEDLKSRGVEKVFVWTAISGYWEGFTSDLGFECWRVPRNGNTYLMPSPRGCYAYYEALFNYLADEGVYGVKLDVMNFLDEISDQNVRRAIQDSYMKAVEYASNKYSIKIIWSMTMVPYVFDWFSRRASTTKGPMRNSDDFFPHIDDSHYWHNYCNIYNAQFARQFGHPLDFDMFQTKLTDSGPGAENVPWLHAATRAISGGPIYVTDDIGTHNPELVKCLVSNGKALRFNEYPVVDDPYQNFDEKRLIIATNGNQYGRVTAYLNLTKESLSQRVEASHDSVKRAWHAKWILSVDSAQKEEVHLDPGAWELVSTVRFDSVKGKRVANFGLLDKLAGLAGIVSQKIEENRVEIVCLPGKLGLYLPDGFPEKAAISGELVDFERDGHMAVLYLTSERKLTLWF